MADDLVEWEWEYCHLAGWLDKGGLQMMIDYHLKQGWEIVERHPFNQEFSDDGTCIMRIKFPTGYSSSRSFLGPIKVDKKGRLIAYIDYMYQILPDDEMFDPWDKGNG